MTDLHPVRILLVGAGAISEHYYVPALAVMQDANQLALVGVCDPNPARTDVVRSHFPGVRAEKTLELLLDLKPDAAIIATPAAFHADQAIMLLRRGCAVLCEKPMATSVAQCQSMIDAARASGAPLAIGLVRRFFPAVSWIRKLMVEREFGRIKSFQFSEGGVFRWPAQSDSFFNRQAGGGGVLLDLGVHALDLVHFWFGAPRSLQYADDCLGGVETNCRVQLHYDDYAGELRLSRDTEMPNTYQITTERARIQWVVGEPARLQVQMRNTPWVLRSELELAADHRRVPAARFPASFQACFLEQLRNFVMAASGREPVAVAGEDGLPSLELIEACQRQRNLMALPWLSQPELERALVLNRAPNA